MKQQKFTEQFATIYDLAIRLSQAADSDALLVLLEGPTDWEELKKRAGKETILIAANDEQQVEGNQRLDEGQNGVSGVEGRHREVGAQGRTKAHVGVPAGQATGPPGVGEELETGQVEEAQVGADEGLAGEERAGEEQAEGQAEEGKERVLPPPTPYLQK